MGLDTPNGQKATQFHEELMQFPPALRKVALQALKADDIYTIQELAEQLQLRVESVYQLIYLQKKKGRDFHKFLSETFRSQLEPYRPKMNKALIKEAQKGSFRHLQLYYQLVGDLRHEPKIEGNNTVNNLCFVLPMPASIPMDEIEEPKDITQYSTGKIDELESIEKPREVEPLRGAIDRNPEEKETVVEPLALKLEVHKCPFCRDSFKALDLLGEHLSGEHEIG